MPSSTSVNLYPIPPSPFTPPHPTHMLPPVTTAPSTSDFERRFGSKRERPGSRGFNMPAEPVGKLFDREPPRSNEAERGLLGAMILDGRVIGDVINIIRSPDAFYSTAHAQIFAAVVAIADRHNDIDPVLLEQRLRDQGQLDGVGGSNYLADLVAATPGSANAVHYARIVSDKFRLRKLIDAAGDILFETYHHGQAEGDEAKKLVDAAEQKIFEIAQEEQAGDIESMERLMQREIELIRAIEEGHTPALGVKSGYTDLDTMLGGLQPGEMIILAARPSMGKTAFALNIAEQIATGKDTPQATHASRPAAPVGIFSLEMGKSALAQRWLSAWSGIESQRIRAGTLNAGKTRHGYVEEMDEYKRLIEAATALAEAPMFVDDTPALSITALRARARRMVSQHGVKCIMIDYLQLLSSPQQARENRQVEVGAISRGIKALARELNIPIIALSQLNRGPEGRDGNRPRMSDLRESGSLEQDADVVLLLHREEYYHKGEPAWDPNHPEFDQNNAERIGVAEIIVAKQRNGPTGLVTLSWDSQTTRFKNFTQGHSGMPAQAPGYAVPYQPNHPHHPSPAQPPRHQAPAANTFTPPPPPPPGTYAAFEGDAPFDENVAPPPPPPRAGGWHAGRQSGPIENHRDGGGPDRDDEEQAPF